MTRWPLSFLRPFPEGGAPLRGWTLRLLGAAGLIGLGLGLFGVITGIVIVTGDTSDGWADLAGGISIMLGVVLLVLGGLLSWGADHAYTRWSDGHPQAERRIQILAWVLIAFGVVYAPFYLIGPDPAPIEDYGMVLFGVGLLAGVAMLVGKDRAA